jgi:hypothetical protein
LDVSSTGTMPTRVVEVVDGGGVVAPEPLDGGAVVVVVGGSGWGRMPWKSSPVVSSTPG